MLRERGSFALAMESRFAPQWSCRARSGTKLPILSEKDVISPGCGRWNCYSSTRIGQNLERYSIVRSILPLVKSWNGRFRFDKTNAIASNRSVPPVTPETGCNRILEHFLLVKSPTKGLKVLKIPFREVTQYRGGSTPLL
jgi:hypothetical protein